MKITIRKIKPSDINWIKKIFIDYWNGDFVVSKGKIHKPEELEGFIAEINNKKVGLVTFKLVRGKIEIVTLNSFLKRKGIGNSLLEKVIKLAKIKKVKIIWLITTNDNLNALKFWQKRGFNIVKIYPNAIKISRKIKPQIPLIGQNGIPLKDEIELEIKIN